jgi:hypothetical protein
MKILNWIKFLFLAETHKDNFNSWEEEKHFTIAPVSIVEESAELTKNELRATNQRMQINLLNALLVKHNVDMSNYTAGFFAALDPDTPGSQIVEMTPLGKLFLSLQDGTFKANTELGEID